MSKIKWISVLSASALMFSLMAPASMAAPTEPMPSPTDWNAERYGERIDIDQSLHELSQDADFLKEAEAKIKAQADTLNDEAAGGEETKADANFTVDGGTKYFYTNSQKFKNFTLRSVGDNVEIWVADDLAYGPNNPKSADVVTQEQVDKLVDEFDSNIYPVATDFFGTPDELDGSNSLFTKWGVFPEGYYEGSDKVIILVDNIQDAGWNNPDYPFFVAGFFWQTIEDYTDRNIVTIDTNSWETRLESTFFATTIHELQHLIQADNDPSEEMWLNEGMSTFSEYLGGYGHGEGAINFFLDHPENSLINWNEHGSAATGPETIADYGQVYLFTLYMYDKFGQEFIRELATDGTSQGRASVNKTLQSYGTGMTFTKLYQNFVAALTLDNSKVSNDYNIDSIDLRNIPVSTDGEVRGKTVDFEKALTVEKEGVPAWGGDFKEFNFGRDVRGMKFDGVEFLPLQWKTAANPVDASEQVLHANNGDEADQALIFEAVVPAENPILTFDHYYDIEEQYDYGMVQVSTDNGDTWTSLENENTRSDIAQGGDLKIAQNVPGFTGYKLNWSTETFDLSTYAGQEVLVSFRNLTDWSYNDTGWFIKNIQVGGFFADGSSTAPFQSLGQFKGEYVDYTTTFIQTKKNGLQRVFHIDPFNVTEQNALDLQQVLREGNVKMITSYAAAEGQKEAKDFTYEVLYQKAIPQKN